MTKRTLYAQLLTLLIGALAGATPAAHAQTLEPPCGPCVAITISSGQALLLPDELNGLTVLIRVSAATDPSLRPSLQAVSQRGGQAGVLVTPPLTASALAERAFELKTLLADLRATIGDTAVLAVEAAAGPASSLWNSDLLSYVDVVVAFGGTPSRVRSWLLVPAADAREVLEATRRGGTEKWVARVPDDILDGRTFIAALAGAAGAPREGFVEDVEVKGARRLSVAEIIARHQGAARRQAAMVRRTILSGVLTLTFEAPGFPAPVTIAADSVIYSDGAQTDLEQRRVRVNGIEFQGGGVPRLPILEPERVAAPPLTITLTNLYRYSGHGEEVVGGLRCYVIGFEPVDGKAALFRGRAWIAMDSFAMVKVAATQTGLRGAIVSSEQVDEFRPTGGVWLLARSDVRQIYEGAAHRTPIHRRLTIVTAEVNPADFQSRREAAYASNSVMLRDTPAGFRYLRRTPAALPGAATVTEVAGAANRVRTLAAGVIIDPNISRPLPFGGLSYVDFNLFGTGAQLNAFFAVAYGQLAFSVPSLGGSRWQLAGRAFGIASEYNDRSFRNGREIYSEAVRQRPAHASTWLLRPLTPRVSLRAGYELDYTRLRAAPETSSDFAVPADQVVHGLRLALEGQRAGWTASLWWNGARRAGWRRWGTGLDYKSADADFQRFGVTIAKATAISANVTTRLEGQWMDGRDLDRFSRYSFGTFDNRLRGYPSALVRYDRGGVLRGAVAWSASKFVRVDGFVDSAAVSDPGFGGGLRNYTGVGLAVEAPAPFGTLAAIEWGYGFRGVRTNGGAGTQVIRISAYKVF